MGQRPSMQTGNRSNHKVVLISDYQRKSASPRILRISPEYDGLELLYANDRHQDTLFSLKVLCWALRDDGSVVAMVPWLRKMVSCVELEDPLNGHWEGYRLPGSQYLFTEAPQHKHMELEAAAHFFADDAPSSNHIQEIPDTIGTHAVCSADDFHTVQLMEVVSWALTAEGTLQAMVADESSITQTPVLPGDGCLRPVNERDDFCYFFQHGIANRIKEKDPEALAALSVLAAD